MALPDQLADLERKVSVRFSAALADLRTRTSSSQEVIQSAVVRAARQLPPEVRAQWRPRLGGTAEP